MAAPTPEAIETARRKVQQAKARLQALEARAASLNRKADARRKIIPGGLLLDAAMNDPAWESHLNDLMSRISRDKDRKAFESWTRWEDRSVGKEWYSRCGYGGSRFLTKKNTHKKDYGDATTLDNK